MTNDELEASAGHGRAQAAVTRPPLAVQVQLLPDALWPVRRLVMPPVFQAGQAGSKPARATFRGQKTKVRDQKSELAVLASDLWLLTSDFWNGQVVERQTREAQNLVPTGREGSNPSLATWAEWRNR